MTDLDPALRRMKANAAVRLRGEAADLQKEAATKIAMAEAIEQTWSLYPREIPPMPENAGKSLDFLANSE